MVGWVPPGISPAYTKPFPGFLPLWHTCSLLRDVRYDSRFQQLTSLPIAEYEALRTGPPTSIVGLSLTPTTPSAAVGAGGRQLDLEVVFAKPAMTDPVTSFGVSVLRSTDGAWVTKISLSRAPAPRPPPPAGPYMPYNDFDIFVGFCCFLTSSGAFRSSMPPHTRRVIWYLLSARVYRMLLGACDPMLCPIPVLFFILFLARFRQRRCVTSAT